MRSSTLAELTLTLTSEAVTFAVSATLVCTVLRKLLSKSVTLPSVIMVDVTRYSVWKPGGTAGDGGGTDGGIVGGMSGGGACGGG
eukprot:6147950-Prymnesium_polylepis.1